MRIRVAGALCFQDHACASGIEDSIVLEVLLTALESALANEIANVLCSDGWNGAHRCLICLHICALQRDHFREITQMLNHCLFLLTGRFDVMDLSYHS
jgi:hypothetical protein